MSLSGLVDRFRGRRIVVLGDLAVDCYVDTRPARLSREAAVMILRYEDRHFGPGCAANTVMNLHGLGADVVPIGIAGDDEAGEALLDAFRAAGIPLDGIAVTGRSVVKVRLMSGDFSRPKQQILRVDFEPEAAGIGEQPMLELMARAGAAQGAEGILVSDYDYGAASPGLLRALRDVAPRARLSVDSHTRIGSYPGADLLTPNEREAAEVLQRRVETDDEAISAARELRELADAGAVLLTRGNHGLVLFDGEAHTIPVAGSREVVDPSGAGDTVVATATLARVVGASFLEAATLANHAAGITVMKAGAACLTPEELKEALPDG